MAIQDSIPINTLERAVSTDVVTAQDLINRSVVNAMQCLARSKIWGTPPVITTRPHVAGGLVLRQSAGVPNLTAGMLMQWVAPNPPDVPAAGTFDSYYRIGYRQDSGNLTDPWDAANRWWLLQARVVRDDALVENRDIYNPVLGTFAVGGPFTKRYESLVEYAWKAGTATTIATEDAGYAPIAGLYRPAGGGAVTDADVVNLAIQIDDLNNVMSVQDVAIPGSKRFYLDVAGFGTADDIAKFRLSGEVAGVKLWAKTTTGVQIRTATFIDPAYIGSIGVDGLWWYIYLGTQANRVPSGIYAGVDHRGYLIASRVPPTAGVNSAQLSVPDPNGGVIAIGDAVHVGYFRANGILQNIDYIDVTVDGDAMIDEIPFSGAVAFAMNQGNTYGSGVYNLAITGAGGTEQMPWGCHWLTLIRPISLDIPEATAYSVWSSFLLPNDILGLAHAEYCSLRSHDVAKFETTPINSLSVTLTSTPRTAGGIVSPGGWPDVGTCEHRCSHYGFRF